MTIVWITERGKKLKLQEVTKNATVNPNSNDCSVMPVCHFRHLYTRSLRRDRPSLIVLSEKTFLQQRNIWQF